MASTTRTAYWTLIPCTPTVAEDGRWTAACAMTEGYTDDQHSHWLSREGVEAVTRHRTGERTAPECYIRTRQTG